MLKRAKHLENYNMLKLSEMLKTLKKYKKTTAAKTFLSGICKNC